MINSRGRTDSNVPQDNGAVQVGYYIVCILDVLGQKQRLKDWARLPNDGRVSDGLIEALRATAGTVLSLKRTLKNFHSRFDRPPSNKKYDRLAPPQQEQFLRLRESTVSTQQFSDTFVFYSSVTNRHGDISGAALYRMLGASATTLLVGLAGKVPLRGAISVGAGMEIEPGNFYGPALADAHYLESEVAVYPRIVLSEEAERLCHRTSGFSRDAEIERLSALYQPKLASLLHDDTDGRTIVDFMGPEIQSLASGRQAIRKAARQAYRFVRDEAERFQAEDNDLLAGRYSRLLSYIEARLSPWGIEKGTL